VMTVTSLSNPGRNEQLVAAGSFEGDAAVWRYLPDLDSFELLEQLPGQGGAVRRVVLGNYGADGREELALAVHSGVDQVRVFRRSGGVSGAPGELALANPLQIRVFPNPFNPRTRVTFTVDRAQSLEAGVYDLAGRPVARLFAGELPAGSHTFIWNGLDGRGRAAPSGTYLVRLAGEDRQGLQKLTLVR
jgi:hypothetical protein